MDFSSPLSAMALPTADNFPINQSGGSPINHSGDLPINQSGPDDCMSDPTEVYFSLEDDKWTIPIETEIPATNPTTNLPIGFKFRPSEEELVLYYLQPEFIDSASAPMGIITHVDIYDYEPRQLSGTCIKSLIDSSVFFHFCVSTRVLKKFLIVFDSSCVGFEEKRKWIIHVMFGGIVFMLL